MYVQHGNVKISAGPCKYCICSDTFHPDCNQPAIQEILDQKQLSLNKKIDRVHFLTSALRVGKLGWPWFCALHTFPCKILSFTFPHMYFMLSPILALILHVLRLIIIVTYISNVLRPETVFDFSTGVNWIVSNLSVSLSDQKHFMKIASFTDKKKDQNYHLSCIWVVWI